MTTHTGSLAKIAIGVGGRFHSDWMLDSLLNAGYATTLFTSLPRNRFPQHRELIHSWLPPELFFRLGRIVGLENFGDQIKIKTFGRHLARCLRRENARSPYDLLFGWSSYSLEVLRARSAKRQVLIRDSSHIQLQMSLLEAEYKKFALPFPNRQWVIDRELEEYELADHIIVLSEFAKQSFVDRGMSASKLSVLRLGVDTSRFTPFRQVTMTKPLRVVYFGTLTLRKGIPYLLEATRGFNPSELELSLIGPVEPEFKVILAQYSHAKLFPKLPQAELAKRIRDQHIFVFPTLEDGFGQTLIQAMASGLVPITTSHCGAGELIVEGNSGFVVEAGSAKALKECLEKLVQNPESLSRIRQQCIDTARRISWIAYRDQLLKLVTQQLS